MASSISGQDDNKGNPTIAVIGGSGLYAMPGIEILDRKSVTTPYGSPSDDLVIGRLSGKKIVFLPRHGVGHKLNPTEINYRANIYALKTLGVERILSVSAVGSMKEEIVPGHIVLPDQFIDRTTKRISTFFSDGIVGHVSMADPICTDLSSLVDEAANDSGATVHKGGTYICIEGPQFSTRAESNVYRSWGVDVIGMTNVTEAKLAREAGLCYVTMALATDYDCWHVSEEAVTVDQIVKIMHKNVVLSQTILKRIAEMSLDDKSCSCGDAAKYSMITNPSCIPDSAKQDLKILFGEL